MPSPRELLEPYLVERALYVAEATVSHDRFHLGLFFEFLDSRSVHEVGAVTFQDLDAYSHHLDTVPGKRGKTASPAHKQKALQVSRLFLSWACCAGHSLVDFERYQLPHRVRVEMVEVPSVEQVKKLLEAPDTSRPQGRRNRLVLESFYTLGLRRRESYQLSLSDISLSKRTVRVLGKRRRERTLPLTDRLTELFRRYLQEDRPRLRPNPGEEALWVSPQTGNRLSFTYLRVVVGGYAKKLGLGNIYPHLLRHACATHMLEGGATLQEIQLFLGHSSPNSTERYAHVGAEELKAVFKACHPRCRNEESGD